MPAAAAAVVVPAARRAALVSFDFISFIRLFRSVITITTLFIIGFHAFKWPFHYCTHPCRSSDLVF